MLARYMDRRLTNGTKPEIKPGELFYLCNVCGTGNWCLAPEMNREGAPCSHCGTNIRYRGVIAALTRAMFGQIRVLRDLPPDKRIRGVGMSDAVCYAKWLEKTFDYTNTFYHTEPLLDITRPGSEYFDRYDFVISTDVFEHVALPIQPAFDNLLRILKPGGVVAFSVPFSLEAETREHFPSLHDFSLRQEEGRWVLENTTAAGVVERFHDLVFHGGEGMTLEFRLFSLDALWRNFVHAGFVDVVVHRDPVFEHGIFWREPWSLVMTARRPAT